MYPRTPSIALEITCHLKQTVYRTPADFKKVDDVVERLELALSEADGKIRLSIHYGDCLATLEFER